MRRLLSLSIVCLIAGLAHNHQALANTLFPLDCSSILTTDGRISIESDADLEKLAKIPRFSSAAGFPTALLIGPELTGRTVQVEVLEGGRVFVRGEILGSRDGWKSFDLKEQQTDLVLKISVDHPDLGIRRVELLDQDLPRSLFKDASAVEELEASFEREARDLKYNARRVKFERTMAWYRRWNGRNMRTTLYDRQDKLARMEYLLGLNKIDETLALLRLDVDNTKVPAVAIHKALARRAELKKIQSDDAFEQQKMAQLDAEIEERLREQGEILGVHYGEFRAIYLKLETITKNESKLYSPQMVSAATLVLKEIGVLNASAGLLPEVMNLRKEPSLGYVQRAFFAQPYALIKKMEKDLWAERLTFTWMIFNKVTGQDLISRNIDGLIEKLPTWARSPLNALRKSKRDMDARRFDLPQIERIAHLSGDAAGKVEELRKVYYGDGASALLKNFARLVDREEQNLWAQLKEAAPADFKIIMEEEAKVASEWGALSKHYHQNQMNMTAAVITAGGVGSGFLYYKYGSHESWLWQALDALVQMLPFAG